MCILICYNVVIDDSKCVSSGGVIQNYEDLVRNYVVSAYSQWVGEFTSFKQTQKAMGYKVDDPFATYTMLLVHTITVIIY